VVTPLKVDGHPSFDQLYGRHAGSVVRLCRLLLRDPQEAQDVSQEIFVKLFKEHRNHTVAEWDRWLRRVTINACRDRRRSAWWRLWRTGTSEPLEENRIAGREATPEQTVMRLETRRELWSAFRRLSTRQREVFALRHVEGLSTTEVAETLGVTEGSAKRHLFRAVRQLRVVLGSQR
jgi:RNA polymerase sigma factor (sigma-70 family)